MPDSQLKINERSIRRGIQSLINITNSIINHTGSNIPVGQVTEITNSENLTILDFNLAKNIALIKLSNTSFGIAKIENKEISSYTTLTKNQLGITADTEIQNACLHYIESSDELCLYAVYFKDVNGTVYFSNTKINSETGQIIRTQTCNCSRGRGYMVVTYQYGITARPGHDEFSVVTTTHGVNLVDNDLYIITNNNNNLVCNRYNLQEYGGADNNRTEYQYAICYYNDSGNNLSISVLKRNTSGTNYGQNRIYSINSSGTIGSTLVNQGTSLNTSSIGIFLTDSIYIYGNSVRNTSNLNNSIYTLPFTLTTSTIFNIANNYIGIYSGNRINIYEITLSSYTLVESFSAAGILTSESEHNCINGTSTNLLKIYRVE